MHEYIFLVVHWLVVSISINLSAAITVGARNNARELNPHSSQHKDLTALEARCFLQEQVPYGSDCYQLLKRGPCKAGEWLLLDFESAVRSEPQLIGICAEKQCNSGDIFWPLDGYCYNVKEGESNLCPDQGTYLHLDPFGEGTCDCKLDGPYVRWFDSANSRSFRCFKAYSQGPCTEGFIVMKKGKRVFCAEDPCFHLQSEDEDSRYIQLEDGGACYRLGSQGPCPPNNKLVMHHELKTPSCTQILNPLHLVNLPTTCKTDHTGRCVNAIEFIENKDKFANQLIRLAKEKKWKTALN